MKVSKYNFYFDVEEKEFYIYNSLSNALMEIDKDAYEKIKRLCNNTICDKEAFEEDLYEALCKNNFLTESDADDFLRYKAIIMAMRKERWGMHLTLAPTMDCCFRCHYCFEKYKEEGYMNTEIMDGIIKYVTSHKDLKSIKITWFGGEPLMAIDQIEQFYEKFSHKWGDKIFMSNIITTGYHLDKHSIEVLKKVRVGAMQITLDGIKETHNKVKYFEGSGDVFEKVMNNIELLKKEAPEINVAVRVNLTKENMHEYTELYRYFQNRFKEYQNIVISPAFVMDRGVSNKSNKTDSVFFGHKDRTEYILGLTGKHGIHSPFIRYPQRYFNECAIRNNLAISFDPEGYAYKCWEVIGDKKYAIGKLSAEGHITEINHRVLNRQLYGADPIEDSTCSKCNYLPICGGGCPIQRIENEFEGGRNCTCIPHKGYMDKFMKMHIAIKKAGFANR